MKLIWKTVVVILDCCPRMSITLHDVLHGLWEGCRKGTSPLYEKTTQQLTSMREEVLYAIFMELHKAYDASDRKICLGILEGYVLGPYA